MKMKEVRTMAKEAGVSVKVGMTKAEAIKMVQRAQGHFDCFGTAENGYCDQKNCLFREDCLSSVQ